MGIVEAPMTPDTTCSARDCENLCVSHDGKRVIETKNGQVQKARCCGVCAKWYCYQHKKEKMRKFINYSKLTSESNYDYEKRAKYTKKSALAVDFNVFKSCGTKCFGSEKENFLIKNCQPLNRLICALKYYKLLKVANDRSTHRIFTEFCQNVYVKVLDDFTHILHSHAGQLQEIHEQVVESENFGPCAIDKCLMFKRHYFGDRRANDVNGSSKNGKKSSSQKHEHSEENAAFLFYRELFDAAHHHIYHLFDIGLREKEEYKNIVNLSDEEFDDDEQEIIDMDSFGIIDAEFKRKYQYLVKQRHILKHYQLDIKRLNERNHKYFINASPPQTDGGLTFIDSISSSFKKDVEGIRLSHRFNRFIKDELYDSDAVQEDLMDEESGPTNSSNIAKHMSNGTFIKMIRQYEKYANNKSLHSFNTGITWYYWKYYKKRMDITHSDNQNINTHHGYNYQDLFVTQYYSSFKTEILNHLSIADYEQFVVLKSSLYRDTEIARSIWANDQDQFLHYGIRKGTLITKAHLMAIILYCDFPDFAAEWKSTFKPLTTYEPLNAIKERNRKFWWMSRTIRESVEIYGHSDRNYYHVYSWRRRETGPFYVGVQGDSNMPRIPQFSLRLCGPVSTSKYSQVALNFMYNSVSSDGANHGMILTLNNNGSTWTKMLTMFDCSWISKYKSEDERLFLGGFEPMRIASVHAIHPQNKEWVSYGVYFHALYLFDNMVNGASLYESNIELVKTDTQIIKTIVSEGYQDEYNIDQYIINCWNAYRQNKTKIVVNMNYLYLHFNAQKVNELIVRSLQRTEDDFEVTADSNMLSDIVFKTFPNTETLVIYTTSMTGKYTYQFDWNRFVEIICLSSTWREIKVISIRYNDEGPSWLFYLWEVHRKQMKANLAQKKLNIVRKQEKNALFGGSVSDYLLITRK